MLEFKQTLEDCRIEDIGFNGNWYTWERGRRASNNIRKWLDRGVANASWMDLFNGNTLSHLTHSFSTHCPLLLVTSDENLIKRSRQFRFEEAWLFEESCMKKVEHIWTAQPREQYEDESVIQDLAAKYFSDLFTLLFEETDQTLLSGVEPCIAEEINTKLCKLFTVEEVTDVVKLMSPLKASGDDGLGTIFYQQCWHIVGTEVAEYCIEILNGTQDIDPIKRTNIVLVPKIKSPRNLAQFRPISLCNVLYKIIAKVLVQRMQEHLHLCTDEAHSALVPRRLIMDNIITTYELLHSFIQKREGRKGCSALKLDMSKAYDVVEWPYLWQMMEK
ncbi:hypothetical protein F3Y22_tig00111441pilonHSYRG00035 [Hibiscus syriacus]|uniref:Reverse transcriptase domain-containing protein n=1 Tax=Hibiscus syriacus TaxID=106335 RepID=A0A6A2YKQ4_HIBSY|nr:hypothetical protein F3Y22_tig00111441pilonHSYRG00035 [Hibiscus syriacus]